MDSRCDPAEFYPRFDTPQEAVLSLNTFNAMTQVIQHDYGKSRVTLLQIRAAIKAVKAERSGTGHAGSKRKSVVVRKAGQACSAKSRKRT
jgi:hypothetical protein